MLKYATWTKREMHDELTARGYNRVPAKAGKALLTALLYADDKGIVNERYY